MGYMFNRKPRTTTKDIPVENKKDLVPTDTVKVKPTQSKGELVPAQTESVESLKIDTLDSSDSVSISYGIKT